MKKLVKITWLTFLAILMMPAWVSAQFVEDFANGNFTSPHTWVGDTGKFRVDAQFQLQLNNQPIADDAYLATAVETGDSTSWDFYIRLEFSPSNNNLAKIYLKSDHPDLTSPLNGYFIRIGVNGSLDAIDLFEQTGTSETLIVAGAPGTVAVNPDCRIRVIRDPTGNWSVYADFTAGTNYVLQGTGFSDRHNLSGWMGVVCRHTQTNATRFFFDDFRVDPLYQDTVAPTLLSLHAEDDTTLRVHFDEAVSSATAEDASRYLLSPGGIVPVTAQIDSSAPAEVLLTLPSPLQSLTTYTLTVSNIEDLKGNNLASAQATFSYYQPMPGDVLIHEIMADPSPPVGMPDVEFIELYNTTSVAIDLANWRYSDAGLEVVLPSFIIPPDSFAILCPVASIADFQSYGLSVGLPSWPVLNNDSDYLTLKAPDGKVIHRVDYRDTWYRDNTKRNGGHSLEMIDPFTMCDGPGNWIASDDPTGGTPGRRNSVWGKYPDTLAPAIASWSLTGADTIIIVWTEEPDSALATNPANYALAPGLSVAAVALVGDTVFLTLNQFLQTGVLYIITVSGVADCIGNVMTPAQIRILIPWPLEPLDLIINEILFNPRTGGVDYLELYNRSDKYALTDGLVLQRLDFASGDLVTTTTVSNTNSVLAPGGYVAFTSNPATVLLHYYTPNPEWVLTVSGMPNYPDRDGGARVLSVEGEVLDEFYYEETWHFPLIRDRNGVSLERIDFDGPTQDRDNWFSAASTVGYGTPAYRNSQFRVFEPFDGVWESDPESFSPDGDGYNDQLFIRYRLTGPGYAAHVRIFDSRGRLVRYLANNVLLETEGHLVWDGTADDTRKVPIGIYVIQVELVNPNGQSKAYKLRCVVAGRM